VRPPKRLDRCQNHAPRFRTTLRGYRNTCSGDFGATRISAIVEDSRSRATPLEVASAVTHSNGATAARRVGRATGHRPSPAIPPSRRPSPCPIREWCLGNPVTASTSVRSGAVEETDRLTPPPAGWPRAEHRDRASHIAARAGRFGRMISTGQVAWWAIWLDTEPSRRLAKPPWPREPTTRRSASFDAVNSTPAAGP